MSAPLRRPAVTGDFAAADWRAPDPGLLARQHEAFGQLLTDLGCEVEVAPLEEPVPSTAPPAESPTPEPVPA